MKQELKCHTIAPATNADGKRLITAVFGTERDVTMTQARSGAPVPWENNIIIYIPEEEWENIKPKFTVGDKFVFNMNGGEITLKRSE